ncbi:MAG: serine hydrolase [Eubacteriales bacterium]
MRKKTKNTVIIITLSCFCAIAAALCIVSFFRMRSAQTSLSVYESQAAEDTAEQPDAPNDDMAQRLETLMIERDSLSEQLAQKTAEYETLKESLASDDAASRLEARIGELEDELSRRKNEISNLNNTIENLESVYSLDLNKQFTLLNSLNELLENPPEYDTGETREVKGDDGSIKKEPVMEKHKISVYYEDIQNGYKYACDADTAYSTASLIKAPFVLAILREAVREDDEIKAALEAGTLSEAEAAEYPRVYDFTKKFTYTDEFYAEGSGKIKDDKEKTEYTYLELIDYLMRYSDNVAYKVLKDEYGIDAFRSMIYELGCTSMYKSLSFMSAADCGKIMKAVYAFIAEENIYSQFLYDAMTNSAHPVMIVYSVYPSKAAHKYGWDSEVYHDMGVVYAENPYVVSVLTDMSEGGDDVNDYIQQIIKLISQLHSNFYAEKKT